MKDRIHLSIPHLSGNESNYVMECFETNFVSTAGPFVNRFEEAMAKFLGVDTSIAVMNGTAALHLSLIDAGVVYGDEVIAPNLTFVAPLNAIRYQGAHPVLIDSSWKTLGMCHESLESFLVQNAEFTPTGIVNKTTKRKIKAIIPMHTLGNCVDMDPILEIAKRYDLKVIEDASESLGANYKGNSTGTIGDYGCFSFNGNKIITSGGGGLVITKRPSSSKNIRHLSTTAKTDNLNFVHDDVGYNYRMVNVLAAIGLGQAEQLNEFLDIKKQNFLKYQNAFVDIPGGEIYEPDESLGSNYWFYAFVLNEKLADKKDEIIREVISEGVEVRPIWELMKNLPPYQNCQSVNCSNSEDMKKRIINIPCSVNLNDEDIKKVRVVFKKVMGRFS